MNSSDDELKVFRRLQDANLFQNIKGERKRKFRSEFIDEEASLSGEDIDSDNEDENADLDEYEKEEGDEDDVPDEETLKLQLSKQWLKEQQVDAEDRKLLYWKEKLFVDGDLHMDTDRTFRLKLRDEANMNDQASCENETGPEDVDDEENEENYDAMKRHIEMLKWKLKTDVSSVKKLDYFRWHFCCPSIFAIFLTKNDFLISIFHSIFFRIHFK
ncbi:unnamed protein product [Dracunculus medinensis]|uniref:Uncharacterized protein n=1 Tax=Dracunculus medinensis TaxID=318479 RepID=A0A3P7Q3X1_DRAME|nr:unnamed protein product [Dracunculus medinensis]